MIKVLNEKNKAEIINYFDKKPLWAQFFAAFIREHGYGSSLFTLYGCFDADNELCGLFGTAAGNIMLFSHNNTLPIDEIYGFLKDNNIKYSILKGQEDLLKLFEAYDSFSTKYATLLCKLRKDDFVEADCSNVIIKRAEEKDIGDMIAFFNCGDELKRYMNEENLADIIGCGHTYLLYNENNTLAAVSVCSSVNSHIANINTITTMPSLRGRGYGTKLLSYTCKQLLKESNACSLCYEHPTSDKIYLKVGFHEIGYQAIYIK